jgi:hypothetical protein
MPNKNNEIRDEMFGNSLPKISTSETRRIEQSLLDPTTWAFWKLPLTIWAVHFGLVLLIWGLMILNPSNSVQLSVVQYVLNFPFCCFAVFLPAQIISGGVWALLVIISRKFLFRWWLLPFIIFLIGLLLVTIWFSTPHGPLM